VFAFQDVQPFIVEIIRPPTEEMTVADVLIGALGLAGAIALAAVPLGVLMGFLLIRWNKRRRPESDRMPHVSPSLEQNESTDRPSSLTQ
jgi:ABC-type phosphate transport system permease subunit